MKSEKLSADFPKGHQNRQRCPIKSFFWNHRKIMEWKFKRNNEKSSVKPLIENQGKNPNFQQTMQNKDDNRWTRFLWWFFNGRHFVVSRWTGDNLFRAWIFCWCFCGVKIESLQHTSRYNTVTYGRSIGSAYFIGFVPIWMNNKFMQILEQKIRKLRTNDQPTVKLFTK